MTTNFFDHACKEHFRKDNLFGICDDQDGKKAYTNTQDAAGWIAHVRNSKKTKVVFTPIDNCIIIFRQGTKDRESTCDGMLTFGKSLYLVELKNQGKGKWLPVAKKQLESTINCLRKNHSLEQYTYKKAYACNKKHPNFTVLGNEEQRAFFQRTGGFRLDAQTQIVLS
jgi:hypothetical protein